MTNHRQARYFLIMPFKVLALGIVTLSSTLLVAVDCFDGGINVDVALIKLITTQLPEAFTKDAQLLALINNQNIYRDNAVTHF